MAAEDSAPECNLNKVSRTALVFVLTLQTVFCDAQWTTSGTNIYNSNSGFVGVGTSSPQSRFHVSNGKITASDPNYYDINIRLDGASIPVMRFTRWLGSGSSYHNAFVGQFWNSGEYSLGIGAGASTTGDWDFYNNAITIITAGSVGIGNTSPLYRLHVSGDGKFEYYTDDNDAEVRLSRVTEGISHGVYAITTTEDGTDQSYGVIGKATTTGTTDCNYCDVVGVFGITETPTGGAYAGFFSGNVAATGFIDDYHSDGRFKEGVIDIKDATKTVNHLEPKEYYFKTNTGFNFPAGKQSGFMAENVKEVLPHLVRKGKIPHLPDEKDSLGLYSIDRNEEYYSMDYRRFIPYLVKAFQEQDERINQQDLALKALFEQVLSEESGKQTTSPHFATISPNPATSEVEVRLQNVDGEVTVLVFSKQGQLIYEVSTRDTFLLLKFDTLESGLYLVALRSGSEILDTERILIIK